MKRDCLTRAALAFTGLVWTATYGVILAQDAEFVDVRIRPEYRDAIFANPFLMQGAVDVITTEGGGEVLVGVGVVAIDPAAQESPAKVLAARTVARSKASQAVARFLQSEVEADTTLQRQVTTETEQVDGREIARVQRVQKFLETRIREKSTMARRILDVGSWMSPDRRVLYFAVGVFPEP